MTKKEKKEEYKYLYGIYKRFKIKFPSLTFDRFTKEITSEEFNQNKKEFKKRWKELNAIVGLMKTDYTEEDLSYERVDAGIGQGGGTIKWEDPEGSDSY